MKLIYKMTLLLAGLILFVSSSSEDDFDRKPVLEPPKDKVTFTKTAERDRSAIL